MSGRCACRMDGWSKARRKGMPRRAWSLLHATVAGYIEDEAMSRGAAIAYYSFFSAAPLLVIAIALALLALAIAIALAVRNRRKSA